MIKLGEFNTLKAYRQTDNGCYLCDEEELNEVLLPNKYVPDNLGQNDTIEVFIYKDSEDRITATTLTPKILLHQFAYLKVKDVNRFGAFLDWGLEKDLMVPYSQQNKKMRPNASYLVYLYIDDQTERLVGSCKLHHFLDQENLTVTQGEEVDVVIWEQTDIGYNAIINDLHKGLIYKNEIFQKIHPGDKLRAYIKEIREDNKIDLSLQKQGYGNVISNIDPIIDALQKSEGFLPLNDKSSPDEIYKRMKMSKKTFKKAIGALYRERKIRIEADGIHLL
ncbi:MAG: S1-like domain-containing RNA-binding protein [Chitinophagales bacterium]